MARWTTCVLSVPHFISVECCAVVDIATEPVMQVTASHAFASMHSMVCLGVVTNTNIGDCLPICRHIINVGWGRLWDGCRSGTGHSPRDGVTESILDTSLQIPGPVTNPKRWIYGRALNTINTSTALSIGDIYHRQEVNSSITRRRVISAPQGSKPSSVRLPPDDMWPTSRTACRIHVR